MLLDRFIVYGQPQCPGCETAKKLLAGRNFDYKEIGTDLTKEEFFETFPGARSVPQIVWNKLHIGGVDKLRKFLIDAEI